MSGARRGGPGRMAPEELARFLGVPRWAALCVEDPDGGLQVEPVWIESTSGETVALTSPEGHRRDEGDARGCLVADEFESYAGIRGAILRGIVTTSPGKGAATQSRSNLTITRAHGFTFEGAATSH